jgi:Ca-activated chloride channel family protein
MNGKPRVLFLLALLTASVVTASDQIGTDPSLVYIHVSVVNPQGRFVTGLNAAAFNITEDKTPQRIVSLSNQDVPISAAIMLDLRGQMKDTLKAAPSSFVTGRHNSADELFFVEPGDKPLNEAVLQGLNSLIQRSTNSTRAFVLLTDRTNPGMSSFSKVKEVLKDQDVEFFVIAIADPRDPARIQDQDVLRDLAKTSGGQAFFPPSVVHVGQIFNTIARDLRYQYVIGYRSTNPAADGQWRKIAVAGSVTNPLTKKVTTLTMRTKAGYYAPTVATGGATQGR